MSEVTAELISFLCLECCDEDKCQRYPKISESCIKFLELLKAYKAGIDRGWEQAQAYYYIDMG